MKILISGASGYVGQHFIHALMQKPDDIEIFSIYRSKDGFEEAVRSHHDVASSRTTKGDTSISIHFNKVDLTAKNEIDEYFDSKGPFDACFHLAAMSHPGAW